MQDASVPSKELKIVRPFNIVAGETAALILDFEKPVRNGQYLYVREIAARENQRLNKHNSYSSSLFQ